MAPSDRITTAIGGDKAQRESAYVELSTLAQGDNADVAAIVGSATLRISGTLGELDDESSLANFFREFGSVVAVTLLRDDAGSWALLTFGEAEQARSAVAGSRVSGVQVDAVDLQEALGSSMGNAMRQHQERISVGVAVACAGPLMETVLGADESMVDATECASIEYILWQQRADKLECVVQYYC
jgi:hypothetical protein